jgi:hypothetical protein
LTAAPTPRPRPLRLNPLRLRRLLLPLRLRRLRRFRLAAVGHPALRGGGLLLAALALLGTTATTAAAVPSTAAPSSAAPTFAVPTPAVQTLAVPAPAATIPARPAPAVPTPAVPTTAGLTRLAAVPASRAVATTALETWAGPTGLLTQTTGATPVASVAVPGAEDGRALRLQLQARPASGPRQGVTMASRNPAYRYGTYGSRLRSADCRGQNRPGVVTGTFVYAMDHSDANGNGLDDNDEIDIEFLCAQPEVIYLTLWTDYDEATDTPRSITRAINLRTGKVLSTCYRLSWTSACPRPLPGENSPTTVTAIPGYNSATRFRTYTFDWQADRVAFHATDDAGRRILLWDYRGPRARIPQRPATFMQNVWHTRNWDPFSGPAHNQPTAPTSAYLDSTILPLAR